MTRCGREVAVSVLARPAALLRLPGARPAVLSALVGRLSFGMTGLAVLLLVRAQTGSYTRAGVASAVYGVTLALSSPLRARQADRGGQTRVLRATGVATPLAVAAFLAAAAAHAPFAVLLALLVLAGAVVPPIGSTMRALWSDIAPDEATRASAYALEGVLIELAFVLGPLFVGLISALSGSAVALAAAGVAASVGALCLAATGHSRAWRPDIDAPAITFAGPLVSAGVRRLLTVYALTGAGFGAVEVAVPAFAEKSGARASTGGLLLAGWALGSAAGGLAYSARDWPGEPVQRWVTLLGVLALGSLLPVLAGGPLTLAPLLFAYGLGIAPSGAVATLLMSQHAPPGTVTEAFGWSTTAIFAGAALGSAVTGAVVDATSPRVGLALVAAGGTAAALVGLRSRQALACL